MTTTTSDIETAWRAYQEACMARNRARTVHINAVTYGSPWRRHHAVQVLAAADRAYREAERAYARARQGGRA